MQLELIDEQIRTVRLPLMSVEWLIDTAVRPTVDLPNCSPPRPRPAPTAPRAPAAAAAPPLKVNGNGSPAIQPGYRKGVAPRNKGKTYPAEILTPAEVAALIAATPRTGPNGYRTRALIVLLWRTGVRIQEALDLEPKDIDFDRLTVTVLRGKNRKRRTIAIDQRAADYVAEWLDYRQRVDGIEPWSPVFCTILAGRDRVAINQAYARRVLKRLARKAGIRRRVHPHGLRHTLAAGLADEGVDLRVVQRQLGHANVAVTARYVDHLTPGKALEVVQARDWPAALGGDEKPERSLDLDRVLRELGADDPQVAERIAVALEQLRGVA